MQLLHCPKAPLKYSLFVKIFVFVSAGKESVFNFGDFLRFCPGYPHTYEMPLVLQFCGPEGQREVQLQRLAGSSAHGSEEYREALSGSL